MASRHDRAAALMNVIARAARMLDQSDAANNRGAIPICASAFEVVAATVAVVQATAPFTHGWWLLAHLILVGGLSQLLLGSGLSPRVAVKDAGSGPTYCCCWFLADSVVIGAALAGRSPRMTVSWPPNFIGVVGPTRGQAEAARAALRSGKVVLEVLAVRHGTFDHAHAHDPCVELVEAGLLTLKRRSRLTEAAAE